MNLWGISVSAGQSVTVEIPMDRDLLITRAALASSTPGPNVIQYTTSDEVQGKATIVLGTLRYEGCEQFELDMCISASSVIKFSLKGKGEVHLSGYFNALCLVDSDESDYDSDELDSEDGFPDFGSEESSSDEDFLSITKSPSESISDDGDDEDVPMIEAYVPESPKKAKKETPKKETPAKEAPEKETATKEAPKKETPAKKQAPQQQAKQTPPKKEAQQQGTKRPISPGSPADRPAKKTKTEGSGFACAPCKREFVSDAALQAHNRAKH